MIILKKMVISKKLVVFILLIVIVIAVPTSKYWYNSYNFSKLYNRGLEQLGKESFDDAINTFNSSLKYKPSQKELIESKVNFAKYLKDSKAVFDSAVALASEKKYLEAIDAFKTIKNTDAKRYSDAQNKIKEFSDIYIKENLDNAKNIASSKNYAKAIAYLDMILKFDNNNKDAQSLKDEYNNEIQKIATETKKAEEDRLAAQKAKDAANIQQSNTSASTTTSAQGSSGSSNSGITYKYVDGDYDKKCIIILNDNSKQIELYFTRHETYDNQFLYNVWQWGAPSELPYTIKFTYNGVVHTYSGMTSRVTQMTEITGARNGSKVNVEVQIQYKDKTYPINVSFN